ncbi:hypothetical protein HDV00_007682 [Rhizophlyctis rosea]|nr:hypothetical protein HDV00_007682 [Rhizophlyctis rosea]
MDDLNWAEAGWRYHTRGIQDLWDWSICWWHDKFLHMFFTEVPAESHRITLRYAIIMPDEAIVDRVTNSYPFQPDFRKQILCEGLHTAAKWDNLRMAKVLIAAGAEDGLAPDLRSLEPDYSEDETDEFDEHDCALAHTTSAEFHALLLATFSYEPATLSDVLWYAVHHDFGYKIQQLLDAGAVILVGMLTEAASEGNLEAVKLLLENGADIHERHEGPFFWATRNDHQDVALYLLEQGANWRVGPHTYYWARQRLN